MLYFFFFLFSFCFVVLFCYSGSLCDYYVFEFGLRVALSYWGLIWVVEAFFFFF